MKEDRYITLELSGEDNVMEVSLYAIGKALSRDPKGGKKLAKILGTMSNGCYGRPSKVGQDIADGIIEDHRTLQQIMIGTLFHTLTAIGGHPMSEYTDDRNADSIHAGRDFFM